MARLVDLSHEIHDGLVTYPGLPEPRISTHLTRDEAEQRYAPGVTFHIGRIDMIANTGTYVDAPFHRYADGVDLSGLPLERVADVDGVLVDATGVHAIDEARLAEVVFAGKAVLLRTGFSRHWGTPDYSGDCPHVTAGAAAALVSGGAAIVGIDSLNIDATTDPERPVHTALLRAGIPIVEHLTNLEALPAGGFRFFAAPPMIRDMGTFPVRAFAVVDS